MTIKLTVAALFATALAGNSMTVLLSPTVNDGSFENNPGADNVGSADWNVLTGAIPFHSLNRSLGPGGPQEGSFSGVVNPGAAGVYGSNAIAATIATGDVFDFSGFFAHQGAGGNSSGYALRLDFSDGTVADLSAGTGATITTSSPLFNGTQRVVVSTANSWENITHQYTYTGAGATDVTLSFFILTNGGQTYFDNFNLTQTPVPEPSTALLAALGVLGLTRRRR